MNDYGKEPPMPNLSAGGSGMDVLVADAAAAAAAARLRARIKHDGADRLDAELLALGVELSAHRMERGAIGFYAAALSIASALRVEPNRLSRFLRPWYEGARDLLEDHGRDMSHADGPEAVRAALRGLAQDTPGREDQGDERPRTRTPAPQDDAHDDAPWELRDRPPVPGPMQAPPSAIWSEALARAESLAPPLEAEGREPTAPPEAPKPLPGASARHQGHAAETSTRTRRGAKGYRFSDLVFGAFFIPGVLLGLVVFLVVLTIPPLSWMTGMAMWQVRPLVQVAFIGLGLWGLSLALLFPPVWLAWVYGKRGWIWAPLAAPVALAVLSFLSTLIVLRSPMHARFEAEMLQWVQLWAPIVAGAALSISFGSRVRGGSRRLFRRIGRWWDETYGGGDKLN
jgi:hypothetical protein